MQQDQEKAENVYDETQHMPRAAEVRGRDMRREKRMPRITEEEKIELENHLGGLLDFERTLLISYVLENLNIEEAARENGFRVTETREILAGVLEKLRQSIKRDWLDHLETEIRLSREATKEGDLMPEEWERLMNLPLPELYLQIVRFFHQRNNAPASLNEVRRAVDVSPIAKGPVWLRSFGPYARMINNVLVAEHLPIRFRAS